MSSGAEPSTEVTSPDAKALRAPRIRSTVRSVDFGIGVAVAVATTALAFWSEAVVAAAPTILLTEVGVAAALLAVVIAALAIFSTFFDNSYRRVLEKASGSVREAMLPYQVVAVVAATGVLVALGTSLLWAALWTWAQALLIGITTGLIAWTTAGGVQLVELTIFHAEQRAKLMRGIEDTKRLAARRRGELPEQRTTRR